MLALPPLESLWNTAAHSQDVVESREASPFYLFRTCFVGLFLSRLVKSKVTFSGNKVFDVEQMIWKYYLKPSYEMISSWNSSPIPFPLCLSPYPRFPSFWSSYSWLKLIRKKKTFWEESFYRDSSCQVVALWVFSAFSINLWMATEWSIPWLCLWWNQCRLPSLGKKTKSTSKSRQQGIML